MQYPVAVSGVTLYNFLHAATSAVRGYDEKAQTSGQGRMGAHLMPRREFRAELNEKMETLKMDPPFCAGISMRASPAGRKSAPRSSRWP